MPRIRIVVLLPLIIAAGLIGLFLSSVTGDKATGLQSTLIGQPAPPLPVETLPGLSPATAESLRSGEVTLVNFWASWCPPCRAEHDTLKELAARGIPIVGVNIRDDSDKALAYLQELGNPFGASAFDPAGRAALAWGVTAPPETFIVDGKGRVLYRFAGPLLESDYEQRFLPELDRALQGE